MLLHEEGKLPHQDTTLISRGMETPDSIEGVLRNVDGDVDILWGTFGDRRYDFSICYSHEVIY